MRRKQFQFIIRKPQFILPDIAILNIVVQIDNIIIRLDAERSVITAPQAFKCIQNTGFIAGIRTEIRPMRQQLRPFALRVNPKQRMPEQGRRIAHICIRKQHGNRFRLNIRQKFLITGTTIQHSTYSPLPLQINKPRRKSTFFQLAAVFLFSGCLSLLSESLNLLSGRLCLRIKCRNRCPIFGFRILSSSRR